MADGMESPDDGFGSRENRLPALMEVLSRRTAAPVDLFSFYIYMRDQQRSVDYLDFWLDVSQHLEVCRTFVREMRRSMMLETPELEKATATGSKRSSQILDQFDLRDTDAANGSIHSERSEDQRVSQVLRENGSNYGSRHSQKGSSEDNKGSGSRPNTPGHTPGHTPGTDRPPRPSFMSSNLGLGNDSSSPADSTPGHKIKREDIRANAEKILYTYLLEGAERQIILPPGIVADITESIEDRGRDDPEVFDDAKNYVAQAMERDAFPGFLRSKALGNLVPPSLMLRLIVGLLSVFGAFWTAFVLVFTNASRATRCWIILPFILGIYALASHQYTMDPILAIAGYSEYTFFDFNKIKEPFVRRLLIKRAIMISFLIMIITAAVVCLFVFVPGKYL